jgi:hypothetical protein
MRKSIAALILLGVAVGGYATAGPFIALRGMKVGITEQDSEKLSEHIDFPTLRMNLKEQINAVVVKESAAQMKDNPFAVLGIAIASKLAESVVESFVTPAGLASLMQGRNPTEPAAVPTAAADVSNGETGDKPEPFKNARYTYDGADRFSVWMKNDKGEEIRFVLTRTWLSWKLTNIIIPMKA